MLKWISFAVFGGALYVTDAHPAAVAVYAACLAVVIGLEIIDHRQARA